MGDVPTEGQVVLEPALRDPCYSPFARKLSIGSFRRIVGYGRETFTGMIRVWTTGLAT
jgi:hypothetical protein